MMPASGAIGCSTHNILFHLVFRKHLLSRRQSVSSLLSSFFFFLFFSFLSLSRLDGYARVATLHNYNHNFLSTRVAVRLCVCVCVGRIFVCQIKAIGKTLWIRFSRLKTTKCQSKSSQVANTLNRTLIVSNRSNLSIATVRERASSSILIYFIIRNRFQMLLERRN